MHSIEEALETLLGALNPIRDTEALPVLDAWHRVLTDTQHARTHVPPSDVSAMDGYAIHTEQVSSGQWTEISQRIPAGRPAEALRPGTAARLFTGSVIPAGADAVVIQENCEARDGQVKIFSQPSPGEHIRPAGQDLQREQAMLGPGHWLLPQDLGTLAAAGIDQVTVYRRLRVGVLSSGDELIEPGQALKPGQIYNANRYTLQGLLQSMNLEVRHYPPIADNLAATEQALSRAAEECDVVITTGGVSVGEEDHIKQAARNLGRLDLWKLRIKPGKPLAFGHLANTPFFGLPGNPVAVFVTFVVLVRPCLMTLQGHRDHHLQTLHYPAAFTIDKPGDRQEYLRVRIEEGRLHTYRSQDSGVLSSTSWANALAIVPPGSTVSAGDSVEVIPFSHLGML